MAGFNFTTTSGDGKFRIGLRPSVLVNGAEFTLTECVTGIWKDDNGNIINKDDSCSIRFKTSLSDSIEDAVNINKFLNRRRVVYDENGRAKILYDFEGHADLMKFIESSIGRDEKNSALLNGSAKSVGEAVLNYFKGKTFVVEEVECFFKTVKDGVEKLEIPISPVTIIKIKGE